MPKFFVKTIVEFCGEIEADSYSDAEAKGWEWETELNYDGVYSIDVEEMEDEEDE